MKKLSLLLIFCLIARIATYGQSTSTLRADGTILVDGKTFFPFGAYNIPYEASEADRIRALNDMIAAGFNITTVADDGRPGSREAINNLLTIADKSNFKLLIAVTNGSVQDYPTIFWAPQKYALYPATLGYILTDDSDNGTYSFDYLAKLHNGVKGYDNKHLTFLTLTGWDASLRSDANSYTSIADASGYQCYSMGAHRYSDWVASTALTQTYLRTLAYVQSAALANHPMILHLQTFSWEDRSNNPRYPTVSELRNMLYTGLAAGIKGVISYDFSFDLKDNQPALWSEFKLLGKDVKSIQGMLLDGRLTRKSTSDAELVSSYWELGDTCLVVLANTTYSKSKTVNLTLPSKYSKHKLTALSTRMASSLVYSNGTLSGSIKNQEVEVYKLTPELTTNTSNFGEKILCTLHPNPVQDELFVDGDISDNATYAITSIDGTILQAGSVGSAINISNLKPALYIIKIKTEEGKSVHRFVKE
ncbi:MAG TPA: T9SS type A sorting domain-containing protein [Cytophagaceae bacterium]